MKQDQFLDFLTPEGRLIFDELCQHLKRNKIHQDADYYSLGTLANSYSVYREAARQLNDKGLLSEPTKTGYQTVSPYAQLMKQEMANIQKLSASFLLDPASRQRLFRGKLNEKKKKEPTEDLD